MITKKQLFLAVISLISIGLVYKLISQYFGKVDDWQYSHYSIGSIDNLHLIILAALGLLVLAWIITAIVFIVKGKSITVEGTKRINPKRIIGISLLVGPIVIISLSLLIISLASSLVISRYFLLLIPISIICFFLWFIVYSWRNKLKLIIIPLITISLLVIVGGAFIVLVSLSGARSSSGVQPSISSYPAIQSSLPIMNKEMGFAVGGAKDINNFRKNIEEGYLPLPTDITYEGLFYEYYFDTGKKEVCQELFCPSYSYAVSADPFSQNDEYYLSVGLNSDMKESDFQRKKLNLVIVLDISGSMGSQFNKYYYDQFGEKIPIEENEEDKEKTKMQIANESVVALIDHLNNDDRFGMVLFESDSHLAKPLKDVGTTNMNAIKDHILELGSRGGTNMEAGMQLGTELFNNFIDSDPTQYENRIIFLTDAMPNTGMIDENGLFGMAKKNSENKIYTTFIGVGVDFNTELIDEITKTKGANYYSVHSAKQFKQRMDDEFEYMVTPLVFNLSLELDAQGYEIEKVYGSPEANEATGEIMRTSTLFPSPTEGAETKGGLILLKLKKLSADSSLKLKVSYENRIGEKSSNESIIELKEMESDFFENTGIRKGILLSRYASLIKNWINDEKEGQSTPSVNYDQGIIVPEDRNKWERQSISLHVSEDYKKLFKEFNDYFKQEMNVIGDSTLDKEIIVLKDLIN